MTRYRFRPALWVAALALPLTTAGVAAAETPPSRAALINACMQDVKNGLKTGQVMTNSQRMMAEEQCRAYAESRMRRAEDAAASPSRPTVDKPPRSATAIPH